MLAALATPAVAADNNTVQGLLAQGFAVAGTITSPAGPGIFLQLPGRLYLCFVSETPQSAALTTRYCKPVQ
jgi:hypothetical protein